MTGHDSHDNTDGEQAADRPGDASTDGWRSGHVDPDTLREHADVRVVEGERTFEPEQFEGLRDRYRRIDGVALVGITTDDGAVLLSGDDTWSPPGTSVEPGADWVAAARDAVTELTGQAVTIDRPKLVELTDFCLAGEESTRFVAPSVHFEASLATDAPGFRENPTIADDVDDPYYEGRGLRWVDAVPDDVHPNHADHVALYLD